MIDWMLGHFDHESRIALVLTITFLLIVAFSVAVLYLLVTIHQVQQGNGGILLRLNTNHASSSDQLINICHALRGCVVVVQKGQS